MATIVRRMSKIYSHLSRSCSIVGASTKRFSSLEKQSECPVCSHNEWDPLEEVIVGIAEGARVPRLGLDIKGAMRPDVYAWINEHAGKPFPEVVIKEAVKEVTEFCKVLEGEGITVRRPDLIDWGTMGDFRTPDFSEGGFHAACPRDSLVIFGNEIIEAPMGWRSRYFETRPFRRLINEYFEKGAKWTCAPKPTMTDDLYDKDYPFEDDDKRTLLTKQGKFVVTEHEPCFDAADITRCGKDVFMQLSQVTNRKGVEWLARHLGSDYRVHGVICLDNYAEHIDCTLVPLRPGLVLVNPERPCLQIDYFKKAGWDVVEAPHPTPSPEEKLSIYTSEWLSMNTLMLDEKRLLASPHETVLHKFFENLGFTVIKVKMTHAFSLGGGFHCWTTDIRRKGTLQNYF